MYQILYLSSAVSTDSLPLFSLTTVIPIITTVIATEQTTPDVCRGKHQQDECLSAWGASTQVQCNEYTLFNHSWRGTSTSFTWCYSLLSMLPFTLNWQVKKCFFRSDSTLQLKALVLHDVNEWMHTSLILSENHTKNPHLSENALVTRHYYEVPLHCKDTFASLRKVQ